MASNNDRAIKQADTVQQSRGIDRNASEATPLVGNKAAARSSGLLGKFGESVLIKSKAANTILFWNTMVYILYGTMFNPSIVFTFPIYQPSASIPFINTIWTIVYGFIAVWLLFYPLAGYLADVHYGRYKVVVSFGLRMMSVTFIVVIIVITVINILFWPIATFLDGSWYASGLTVYLGISLIIGILAYVMLFIGFAAFAANVIQFGVDQLQDLSVRDSFLFVHWFIFTQYIGISVGKLVWSTSIATFFLSLVVFGLAILIFVIVIPLSLCITKSRWFINSRDTGSRNPYREVAEVVRFARRHKISFQHSTTTSQEHNTPTGLDLGKSKYGGPFTTEQVENVKAFFGILFVLLSLGPFFTADIAASAFLPILSQHMDNEDYEYSKTILRSLFANGGTLYPQSILVFIPVYLLILEPLFRRYTPKIMKRIGIGLCLITVSLLCSLLVDTIGHALPGRENVLSVFYPGQYANITEHFDNETVSYYEFEPAPSLQLSSYILVIQNLIVAVAYVLIYGGVFEFICAQSPNSLRGVLIGTFFAVKGLFQLIGVAGILLPFSFWQKSPRVGMVYFLVNIVISVVGVSAFTVAVKRYNSHQHKEFRKERNYKEELNDGRENYNPVFQINLSDNEIHA